MMLHKKILNLNKLMLKRILKFKIGMLGRNQESNVFNKIMMKKKMI